MPQQNTRLRGRVHVALLSVALGGGCAVYEIPTLAGAPGGATGGLHDGDGSAGSPADPDGWGGQPASLAVDDGQGGASDGDGGARNSGTAGASGGSESAGEDGGAAGRWQGENQGGNGGAASGGGSVAGSTSCAAGWRDQTACDQCVAQVQPDLRACAVILDCYVGKNCGPSSCANTDQKCGPNVLGEGAAAYSVAQDVYACMCN